MDAPETGPRRRITRIGLHAAQVQIAGRAPLLGIVAKLIATQIVLVCLWVSWDIMPEDPLFPRRELQSKRVDHVLGEFVLHTKHMADRSLSGVGTHQRSVCCIRKLCRNSNFVACGEK